MSIRDEDEPTLLDGLRLLLGDGKSGLGWRIVAQQLLDPKDFEHLVQRTAEEGGEDVSKLIGDANRKQVQDMLKTLKAVQKNKGADESAVADLLKKVNVDLHEMAEDYLRDEIRSGVQRSSNPGIRKLPMTATTVQSSKGLDADYVFITHFDDRYFIRDKDKAKVSDQDICGFLVALTRARKRVYLISSDSGQTPLFLKWIREKRIRQVTFAGNPAP